MTFRCLKRFGSLVAGLGVLLLVMAPAGFAQTSYPSPPTPRNTDPCTPVVTNLCHVSVGASTAQRATASSSSLPFTGGNIALLVGLGLVVLVAGVVIVRLARRPSLDT